jgi:hypothetical protein
MYNTTFEPVDQPEDYLHVYLPDWIDIQRTLLSRLPLQLRVHGDIKANQHWHIHLLFLRLFLGFLSLLVLVYEGSVNVFRPFDIFDAISTIMPSSDHPRVTTLPFRERKIH